MLMRVWTTTSKNEDSDMTWVIYDSLFMLSSLLKHDNMNTPMEAQRKSKSVLMRVDKIR